MRKLYAIIYNQIIRNREVFYHFCVQKTNLGIVVLGLKQYLSFYIYFLRGGWTCYMLTVACKVIISIKK